MPVIKSVASGKFILAGEHAVVYGRPAIAVPFHAVEAKATITPSPRSEPGLVTIDAPDIQLRTTAAELPDDHPIKLTLTTIIKQLHLQRLPACTIRITSTIPIAAGLGSSAATTIAIIRTVTSFLGHALPPEIISQMAFEVEKTQHGNPSGIDNTTISHAQPIWFIKGQPFDVIPISHPFTFILADTGVQARTATTVNAVREKLEANPTHLEQQLDSVAQLVIKVRSSLESGNFATCGAAMTANHHILQDLGVSHPLLDKFVDAAIKAGALGAKLTGGGGGGNMLALVSPETCEKVDDALRQAGAVKTYITHLGPNHAEIH
jgi:mevalonate kinase